MLSLPVHSQGIDLAPAVASIGAQAFAPVFGQMMHTAFHVPYVAVYAWKDGETALHLSSAQGAPDVTGDCWDIYVDNVASNDDLWLQIRQLLKSHPRVLGHTRSSDIANPRQRVEIYLRHQLKAKLSAYSRLADGTILSCNLYRTISQADFDGRLSESWSDVAPWVMAMLARHLELARAGGAGAATPDGWMSARLQDICPDLSEREREVIALLMLGRSYKEVARILHISAATAKTYRERGFRRMGVTSAYEAYGQVGLS